VRIFFVAAGGFLNMWRNGSKVARRFANVASNSCQNAQHPSSGARNFLALACTFVEAARHFPAGALNFAKICLHFSKVKSRTGPLAPAFSIGNQHKINN
jgi:hypothetical protein